MSLTTLAELNLGNNKIKTLPDEIDKLALNLNRFRKGIQGDFGHKVKTLNALTEDLIIAKEKYLSKNLSCLINIQLFICK